MNIRKLTATALFIALGLILPTLFHVLGAGTVFLPMHIPVLLAGFSLGPVYGLITGILTPLLSSFITGMPPIFPTGFIMVFELATYGFISGYLYRNRNLNIYLSLIISMICGRVVAGLLSMIIYGIQGNSYSISLFLSSYFLTAIPGILIQLVFIPPIVLSINRILQTKANHE